MWIYIIPIALLIGAIVAFVIFKNSNTKALHKNTDNALPDTSNANSLVEVDTELDIKFEELPALSDDELQCMEEVNDPTIITRLDSLIPGAMQVLSASRLKLNGELYRAILPKGEKLAKSRAMPDAFRGIYHDKDNKINHANFKRNNNKVNNAFAKASAVMGVASIIVGQYYMTEINNKLEKITAEIDKISSFLETEYMSRVYALIAAVQQSSKFQIETLENDEVRNRELVHLKNLEDECAKLLGQANLRLQELTQNKYDDTEKYRNTVSEAQKWYQSQQVLLKIIHKIGELTYTLNLGAISKENAYAMCLPYTEQSAKALDSLKDWHTKAIESLEIDLDSAKIKDTGFWASIFGVFNDNAKYSTIEEQTVSMINSQLTGTATPMITDKTDLFKEDVGLIVKNGKLYYLPPVVHE